MRNRVYRALGDVLWILGIIKLWELIITFPDWL